MDKPSSTWLERYRAVQRPVEVLFCIAVIAVQGVLNTAVTLVDMRAAGRLQAWWQPVLWEASSHLMVLLLIPAVVAWNRRFPLHWDTVRRHLPWHLAGSVLFSLLQFGVGAQFVWPGNRWLELHMGGLSALVAATGSFLFIEQVLAGKDMGPGLSRLMKLGAVLTTASALLYALDIISVQQVTLIVSVLGLAPAMLGLPGAWRRARRGDPVGHSFLLAWAVYAVSTWTLIAVIKGQVGANFWTLHAFQFGATLDMLIFMRVLGLQTRALKLAAQAARLERDNLHSMAHTDPLTGLPNRRMLNSAVSTAINQRRPDELVAVYMLDLDGFKQVNDEYGHDTGDALLVEVAHRLQASLRSSDMVSRLGGEWR